MLGYEKSKLPEMPKVDEVLTVHLAKVPEMRKVHV
jgi:hypothetical protein